jgi:prepilin-type N-terminal cleavage/methylation domain-containing protein
VKSFPRNGDDGVTLVELLVTMALMGVVALLVTAATISTHRVVRQTDDESQGLSDAKVVSERLSRDLRDARGIAAGADAHHLVIWIDFNSDYIQQSNETISWQLQSNPGNNGHYDVIRTVQGQQEVVEARTLISDIAFSYSPAPPATNLVTTSMTYDAILGHGATTRTVTFSTRLRNVG